MKPFFTLIAADNSKSLAESYIQVNRLTDPGLNVFETTEATLLFVRGENSSLNAENVEVSSQPREYFFGFGSIVSKSKGILGNKFSDKIKTIFQAGMDPKMDFVNGIYCGIHFTENKISLFNDFFGLSNVFYYQKDKRFILSSSFQQLYKLVRQIDDVSWNMAGLKEYLSLGKTISGNTLINNIQMLLPARELIITKDKVVQQIYRNFPDDSIKKISFDEAVEISSREVRDAIDRIYDEQYRYCLSISGGCDSRLVFFEWPGRSTLLTESYGNDDNSDILKARQLIRAYGNIQLHEMEQGYPEKYTEGLFAYFDNIDYIPMAGDDNSHHLDWKLSRNAEIRLGGTDGELLGGENLYLNRKPWYVLKEGFFSYPYLKLTGGKSHKASLLSNVLYRHAKKSISELLPGEIIDFDRIVDDWDGYLGKCHSGEVYTERFRTWHTVIDHNYHFTNYFLGKASQLTPYQDFCITDFISRTEPKHRELRKIEICLLQRHSIGKHIPIDTTHLKIDRPYRMHKFFRMLRFALNIGYSRRVPFLQKGTPLKTTIPAFYAPANDAFRKKVLETVRDIQVLDKELLNQYLRQFDHLDSYNHFQATHEGWPNLFILLRLAVFEKKLKALCTDS